MTPSRKSQSFLRKHSLSLAALAVVLALIGLYLLRSGDSPRLVLRERDCGLDRSLRHYRDDEVSIRKRIDREQAAEGHFAVSVAEFLREHSLTIFLVITGIGWIVAFAAMDPASKWGQVVGNIVSEWTQILGLVLLTKRLIEVGSKEN